MRAARGRAVVAVALAAGLTVGCSGDELRFRARFGHLPKSQESSCPAEPVPKPDYLSEIGVFRVRIDGPGMAEPVQRDFTAADAQASGKLEVNGVLSGDDRSVMVAGYVGDTVRWRGLRSGVRVEAGQSQDVGVLVTRVAAMTCGRGPLSTPRMFASSTLLKDGRVLIAGGFHEVAEYNGLCPGCRRYTATATAEIYDPAKGSFSEVGQLSQPRGLHRAARLGDGRVLIVGGAGALTYHNDPSGSPFPLVPDQHRISMEIFDPASGTFSAGPDDPGLARVFHTATSLADGRVLVAGGGDEVRTNNAKQDTALCEAGGGGVTCVVGTPLIHQRIGHTATLLEDTRVFFWGGVTDDTATGNNCSDLGVTQCPEWFVPGDDSFVPVDSGNPLQGASPAQNLFFSAAVSLGGDGVLIAGGLKRNNNSGELELSGPQQKAYLYLPRSNTIGDRFEHVEESFQLREPRYLLQASPLGRAGRAIFMGGYRDLDLVSPADDLDIFDIYEDGFIPDIVVAEQPVLLRQARGGLAIAHVGGGAVVAVGGEDAINPAPMRQILGTAEIFTDKVEPQL